MKKIIGCTKDGLLDMLWCDKCKFKPETIDCIKLRYPIKHGYIED